MNPGYPKYWRAVSGTIAWSANVSGRCRGNASGSIPIKLSGGADGGHMAGLQIKEDGGTLRFSGTNGPVPDALAPKVTLTCPENTLEMPLMVANWWHTDPLGHPVSPDGKTLTGTYSLPGLGATQSLKWSWTLRSIP